MILPQFPANELRWCPEHHETTVDTEKRCVRCGAKTQTLQQHEEQQTPAEVTTEA